MSDLLSIFNYKAFLYDIQPVAGQFPDIHLLLQLTIFAAAAIETGGR